MTSLFERDDPLNKLYLELEEKAHLGQSIDRETYLAQYPEFETELREYFAGLDAIGTMLIRIEPGTKIGDYEVLGYLGKGGMGVVFKARDVRLNMLVAIKMIREDLVVNKEIRQRFYTEAENVARLDHPHIVPVYKVGEYNGLPYFVMKFIEGSNLHKMLQNSQDAETVREPRTDQPGQGRSTGLNGSSPSVVANSQKRLSPPLSQGRTATILLHMAQAVQHAHERGIIHRDLKPHNILMDEQGVPYVNDFGLAKKVDETGQTEGGTVQGTYRYMSPEQASGLDATTAVDVYGLGAVLFEMLVGRPPFEGDNVQELLNKVKNEKPPPPRTLCKNVDPDLETICLICLEKDPTKRYDSAKAVAGDVELWQRVEPITRRRGSRWERLCKWVRRKPAVAALLSTLVLLTILGVGLVTWQMIEKTQALERAEGQLYLNQIAVAASYLRDGKLDRVEETLDRCREDQRLWEWYYLKRLCHPSDLPRFRHTTSVRASAWSPDGKRLAALSGDGTLRVWEGNGVLRYSMPVGAAATDALCFAVEGRYLLTASSRDQLLTLWDLESGTRLQVPSGGALVAAGRSSRRIATVVGEVSVKLWEIVEQGGRVGLREEGSLPPMKDHHRIVAITFSQDARYLAVSGSNRLVQAWEFPSGALRAATTLACLVPSPALPWMVAADCACPVHFRPMPPIEHDRNFKFNIVRAVAFNPEGTKLASGSNWPTVWDVRTGKVDRILTGAGDLLCYGIHFSSDGHRIAATFSNGIRVWDVRNGQAVASINPRGQFNCGANFSPIKPTEIAVARDRELRIEEVAAAPRSSHIPLKPEEDPKRYPLHSVGCSPDGRRFAVRGDDYVLLYDADSPHTGGKIRLEAPAGFRTQLEFSSDGTLLFTSVGETGVRAWEPETGQLSRKFTQAFQGAQLLACASDGRLATSDRVNLALWSAKGTRPEWQVKGLSGEIHGMIFSPDGKWLACSGSNGMVALCDPADGKEVHRCRGHISRVTALAFDPKSQLLATGSDDLTIRLWNVRDGRSRALLVAHTGSVAGLAFSPDGRRLASCGHDATIKIWDVASGQEVLTLPGPGHDGPVTGIAFSRDGRRLVSCGYDGFVRLWDARPLGE